MFWRIEGAEQPLYTGKSFVQYVVHKKTGKKYYCGEGLFYKKKNYPKKLLEDEGDFINGKMQCIYDFYYNIIPPVRIEKRGLFKECRVYSVGRKDREEEYLDFFVLWKIEGLEPTMYTCKPVDIIRDKRTGKEYKRGELVRFRNEDETPFPTAEYTDNFEYISMLNKGGTITSTEYTRDIWVNNFFNSIFKKR